MRTVIPYCRFANMVLRETVWLIFTCVCFGISITSAQTCVVGTSTIAEGEVDRSAFMQCFLLDDCSLSSPGDRIYWQKSIDGNWENLFIYNGDTKENSAIKRDDGHDLTGRSHGELVTDEHKLTINTTTLCDGGQWRCYVISNEVNYPSMNDRIFTVKATTNADDFELEPSNTVVLLAGRPETFNCRIDTISPAGTVMWSFDSLEEVGNERGSSKECGWNIDNQISKTFDTVGSKTVLCILDQNGENTESNEFVYILHGPPHIENDGIKVSESAPLANESYSVTCVASGGNVKISWTLNGQEINDDKYFTRKHDEQVSLPDLPYGQTEATKSALESKIFSAPTIDSIGNQNGTFVCRATVKSHNGLVQVQSNEKDVELRYKPLINGSSSISIKFQNNATLTCNCVAPADVKYLWNQFINGIADKIPDETSWTYRAIHAGNYSCEASNELGKVQIFFLLDELTDSGPNVGAIVGGILGAFVVMCASVGIMIYSYRSNAGRQADTNKHTYENQTQTNDSHPQEYENMSDIVLDSRNADYSTLDHTAEYANGQINVYDVLKNNDKYET